MRNFQNIKKVVVKLGSSLLTNEGMGLDIKRIEHLSEQIAQLHKKHQIIIVSSGAVAEGFSRLKRKKSQYIGHKQAAAAVGQMGLIQAYADTFEKHNIHTAQLLLTGEDLTNRSRYLNAKTTLQTLLDWQVIPIINENDTVTVDEIRLGDNDTLSALVSQLIEADLLILLTDQAGLYNEDPRKNPQAKLIQSARANDKTLEGLAGDAGSSVGTGGMYTKILAAQKAEKNGTSTLIANGFEENILLRLIHGEVLGTHLIAEEKKPFTKKLWLASSQVKGKLFLDQGASHAIQQQGKSLLAIGITDIQGQFSRGDIISCLALDGTEIARGLTNYNTNEIQQIKGKVSNEIEKTLGYIVDDTVIHRDNLVIIT